MSKVFFIDPQSYNNLSTYDFSLLSAVKGHNIIYYYSDLYQLAELPASESRCRFHYSRRKLGVMKGLSYVWSMLRVLFDVWRERPEVVHIQWIRIWRIDYLMARLFRQLGCRVVFTAHNILPHIRRSGDEVHYRKYYELVDRIIVHNHRTKQEMVDMLHIDPDKIEVIFHGILNCGVASSHVTGRAAELRSQLQFDDDTMVFAALGVQKPYKGINEIIEVWSTTPELRDNPKCRLLIMGRRHGIDYSPIRDIANVVAEDTMLSDLDFEAYLALSSVVLLTYRTISQSGLLFSCVNRETPVLISDVGGLPETLSYGRIGWNIGTLTIENLRKHLLHLAGHPEEVAAVKADKAAFEAIREVYGWESIGEKTSQLYGQL